MGKVSEKVDSQLIYRKIIEIMEKEKILRDIFKPDEIYQALTRTHRGRKRKNLPSYL
jgi:hypothetical protein